MEHKIFKLVISEILFVYKKKKKRKENTLKNTILQK